MRKNPGRGLQGSQGDGQRGSQVGHSEVCVTTVSTLLGQGPAPRQHAHRTGARTPEGPFRRTVPQGGPHLTSQPARSLVLGFHPPGHTHPVTPGLCLSLPPGHTRAASQPPKYTRTLPSLKTSGRSTPLENSPNPSNQSGCGTASHHGNRDLTPLSCLRPVPDSTPQSCVPAGP